MSCTLLTRVSWYTWMICSVTESWENTRRECLVVTQLLPHSSSSSLSLSLSVGGLCSLYSGWQRAQLMITVFLQKNSRHAASNCRWNPPVVRRWIQPFQKHCLREQQYSITQSLSVSTRLNANTLMRVNVGFLTECCLTSDEFAVFIAH